MSAPFVEIPLTQGKVALIDAADVALVSAYKWHASIGRRKTGPDVYYAKGWLPREGKPLRAVHMHRLILGAARDIDVDHINHDGLDNRRINLRAATRGQNCANRGTFSNGLGFRGVWRRGNRYWGRVSIRHDGIKRDILTDLSFDNVEDAAQARDALAIQHFGTFAALNFPHASTLLHQQDDGE